jgi:hypothetical protein
MKVLAADPRRRFPRRYSEKVAPLQTAIPDENIVCITLPATGQDDLVWSRELCMAETEWRLGKKVVWAIDLGIDPICSSLMNEQLFQERLLAIEAFSRLYARCSPSSLEPEGSYRDEIVAVLLAETSLFRQLSTQDLYEPSIQLDEPFHTYLAAMTLFADYLHRLAAFLPETVKVMVSVLEDSYEGREILLSKERFRHISVGLEESVGAVGCVIPGDSYCDAKTRSRFSKMLHAKKKENIAVRCIPEALLNEEWVGLDTLLFLEGSVTKQGKRMAEGFVASGGKVEYYETTE